MQLPPEPDAPVIHDRSYTVRSYRLSETSMQMRGIVGDQKPPGLYFKNDAEPLPVHHMVVDLILDFPSLQITDVSVVMEVTPHHECTDIEPHYQQLVGLSIARGFSRKVKELFGGSLGCTHIGALLQAMAPVAVQSIWSMRAISESKDGTPVSVRKRVPDDLEGLSEEEKLEARRRALAFNINSCHMWDEDGDLTTTVLRGDALHPPVWAEERMDKLGIDHDAWMSI